jgi:hypothetical protein
LPGSAEKYTSLHGEKAGPGAARNTKIPMNYFHSWDKKQAQRSILLCAKPEMVLLVDMSKVNI